jgi:signal transduction histidine kinase
MSLPLSQLPTAAADRESVQDVERAMASFSTISANLLASYNALEARAARVEEELAVTNLALEAKVAELDAVLEALPVGVVVRDAGGRVQRVNRNLVETIGVDPAEVIGQREIPTLTTARAQRGRVLVANDRPLQLDLRRSVVRRADGETLGTVEIVDDRTELEELTERVHAMDKVAALGTMAGGIAHEIRNPLNAVAGFAEMLELRLASSDDEKAIRWSQLIVRGAAEANAIITSLLTITTPESIDLETLDAKSLIEEALETAREFSSLCSTNSIIHVHANCPAFAGDRIKLRQALRNLIANAQDAAPGKELIVEAALENDEVILSVSDAGPGIAPELRRRVLDPFFTTRAEGCGLGLALTNTIANLHGGRLDIQPTPSDLGGARVAIHLPHHQASA